MVIVSSHNIRRRALSMVNLAPSNKKSNHVLESAEFSKWTSTSDISVLKEDKFKKVETLVRDALEGWNTIVTIVLVEAKGLPNPPNDGTSHEIYGKFRLGSETIRSKPVQTSIHPVWNERFQLHIYSDSNLRVSLRDKGRQKYFMGRCILDLSQLEQDRTHEIWTELDNGFGSLHVSVTMCTIKNAPVNLNDNVQTFIKDRHKYSLSNLRSDWCLIGELHVKVVGAKGLIGKPHAYCVLEVGNQRVQTQSDKATADPTWNKSYIFKIYDMTSSLDIKIYDNFIFNAIKPESLGRISVPLLRINNNERKWYALKDRHKRNIAKGNCPRILMETQIIWNPLKATLKLFQPKDVKYIKKSPKFDTGLVHSNLEFVRDAFNFAEEVNRQYKSLFEWENTELSAMALVAWLNFWYFFQIWMLPLILLCPFLYFWIFQRTHQYNSTLRNYSHPIDKTTNEGGKVKRSLSNKLVGLPELTLTITSGVEFTASLAERLYNLASFRVPFLSYIAIIILTSLSITLYFVPVNYLLMMFGSYKFIRKYRNPQRKPNNDLLDFVLRIPDNEALKDWKELPVPEPKQRQNSLSLK